MKKTCCEITQLLSDVYSLDHMQVMTGERESEGLKKG